MTWLDWTGVSFCFLAAVWFLAWVFNGLHEAWPRSTELPAPSATAPRSPTELFLEGGGNLSNPRVAALLAEAERGWNQHNTPAGQPNPPTQPGILHAHQITADDEALLRSGASVAPESWITLPSGRTVTGVEFQRWAAHLTEN